MTSVHGATRFLFLSRSTRLMGGEKMLLLSRCTRPKYRKSWFRLKSWNMHLVMLWTAETGWIASKTLPHSVPGRHPCLPFGRLIGFLQHSWGPLKGILRGPEAPSTAPGGQIWFSCPQFARLCWTQCNNILWPGIGLFWAHRGLKETVFGPLSTSFLFDFDFDRPPSNSQFEISEKLNEMN